MTKAAAETSGRKTRRETEWRKRRACHDAGTSASSAAARSAMLAGNGGGGRTARKHKSARRAWRASPRCSGWWRCA